MPVTHGGQHSYGTKLQRSSTIGLSKGRGRIDNIRSLSRLVRHRAATYAALAGPPSSRTWCLAHARSLMATHQSIRIARDEALSVASAVAVARRLSEVWLTPSACTVDPVTAGLMRGPPRCVPSSLKPRISSACFCMGAPQCGAIFSDLASHV
jgi:hypothetical protein